MRLLRLARAAWDAERLYLRRQVHVRRMQAGFAAAAGLALLLLMLMLHLAAFAALAPGSGPVGAALLLAAGDLVLLALCAWLALRAGHDPIGEEALKLRQDAMQQMGDDAARAMVMLPLLRDQTAKGGLLGAAVTALGVGLLSRR